MVFGGLKTRSFPSKNKSEHSNSQNKMGRSQLTGKKISPSELHMKSNSSWTAGFLGVSGRVIVFSCRIFLMLRGAGVWPPKRKLTKDSSSSSFVNFKGDESNSSLWIMKRTYFIFLNFKSDSKLKKKIWIKNSKLEFFLVPKINLRNSIF